MAKLKKGRYYSTCSEAEYAKMTANLRARTAQMEKESDEQELAAYYAIQEIRKNRALSKLKQFNKEVVMSEEAIDRKFSKEDIQTAKELARDYYIIIEPNDDLGFVGHCSEMPHVMNDGATEEDCKDSVREAIEVALAYMLEAGIPIPQPKSIFDDDKYKSYKKVAGMEMHTEDFEHFYIHNTSGSGCIWSTESVDVLKMLHTKLGEFIEEVEKCKK